MAPQNLRFVKLLMSALFWTQREKTAIFDIKLEFVTQQREYEYFIYLLYLKRKYIYILLYTLLVHKVSTLFMILTV